jgi:hypothetical protein
MFNAALDASTRACDLSPGNRVVLEQRARILMGRAHARAEQGAATEADFNEALAIIEGIGREDPAQWDWRVLAVHWHISRSKAASDCGDAGGALLWAERGADLASREFGGPDRDPHTREALLASRLQRGLCLREVGQPDRAAREFEAIARLAALQGDAATEAQALQLAATSRAPERSEAAPE